MGLGTETTTARLIHDRGKTAATSQVCSRFQDLENPTNWTNPSHHEAQFDFDTSSAMVEWT
jgi:hypothetical protein